ncbi:MAG: hypothetical protein FJX72_21070 [Armatimonadetes bacterium]|nr:hypothetical protein [Armatimonadota bacterium]
MAQAEGTLRQDAAGLRAALIPIALDAVDDNLIRRYQSDADIRAVEAVRAKADLLLRVQTVQTPRRTSQTRVFARFAGDPSLGQSGGLLALRAQGARVTGSPGVRRLSDTTGVTMVVPLRDLGYARSAVIEVETTVANVVVDRTGPRMIHIRYGR